MEAVVIWVSLWQILNSKHWNISVSYAMWYHDSGLLVINQHRSNQDLKIEEMSDYKSRVSCQKGPTRHAYAWQIGPFWQDTLEVWYS